MRWSPGRRRIFQCQTAILVMLMLLFSLPEGEWPPNIGRLPAIAQTVGKLGENPQQRSLHASSEIAAASHNNPAENL